MSDSPRILLQPRDRGVISDRLSSASRRASPPLGAKVTLDGDNRRSWGRLNPGINAPIR